MNKKHCPPHYYRIPCGEKVGTCVYCGQQKEFLDWDDIVATVIRRRNYGRKYPGCPATTSHSPGQPTASDKGLQPLSVETKIFPTQVGKTEKTIAPSEHGVDNAKNS